ncbi:hypothetical protein GA0070613_0630 [Micromonospora inositola]|uniref:Uncharacterized protein n=1 Tax=Micromonospora inositola TaxID=47865 RepID=A0A1C5GZV2_9ACTN|nr:hypothetical protein GA0070613_0630 [Micromonospora inositola]
MGSPVHRWPAALALVLLLSGCGGGIERTAQLPAWQTPSPTAPAPLAAKEAKGRYLAIVAPYNTALEELQEAMKAGKPWRTVRTLARAVATTNAAHAEQLRTTAWPAKAQAPVAALLKENDLALPHWKLAGEATGAAALMREIRAAAAHDGGAQANKVRASLGLPVYKKP